MSAYKFRDGDYPMDPIDQRDFHLERREAAEEEIARLTSELVAMTQKRDVFRAVLHGLEFENLDLLHKHGIEGGLQLGIAAKKIIDEKTKELERYKKEGPDDLEARRILDWIDWARSDKQMEDWRHMNAGWNEAGRLKKELDSAKAMVEESRREGWSATGKKIEEICAEFGDDPKACLGIIGEWFNGEQKKPAKGTIGLMASVAEDFMRLPDGGAEKKR